MSPRTSSSPEAGVDGATHAVGVWSPGQTSFPGCIHLRRRIHAGFLADMGELHRIGEAAVGHHRPQFGRAGFGEQQPRVSTPNQ